jgi:hypothetical protein
MCCVACDTGLKDGWCCRCWRNQLEGSDGAVDAGVEAGDGAGDAGGKPSTTDDEAKRVVRRGGEGQLCWRMIKNKQGSLNLIVR